MQQLDAEKQKEATDKEIKQLVKNKIFKLVKLLLGYITLDRKQVLKVKYRAKNEILKYKA